MDPLKGLRTLLGKAEAGLGSKNPTLVRAHQYLQEAEGILSGLSPPPADLDQQAARLAQDLYGPLLPALLAGYRSLIQRDILPGPPGKEIQAAAGRRGIQLTAEELNSLDQFYYSDRIASALTWAGYAPWYRWYRRGKYREKARSLAEEAQSRGIRLEEDVLKALR